MVIVPSNYCFMMRNKLVIILVLGLIISASPPAAAAYDFNSSSADLKVPPSVFVDSVKSTIQTVRDVIGIVSKFSGGQLGGGDFRLSKAVADCLDLLDFSADQLTWTLSVTSQNLTPSAVEALSLDKQWGSYIPDYVGSQKLVFTLEDPKACFANNRPVKVSIENKDKNIYCNNFQINGYFPDRECSIVDSKGDVVAQVGVCKEVKEVMENKDIFHVVVKPGIDQAFVVGVIAILDYIHNGSTRC